MAIDREDVISTLNNLIETCKDAQQGFQTAADGVKNSELKTLFHTYSQQRAQFVAELQEEVRRLGGDPEQTGSVVASLHRGWINIKSAVTGEDEGAIIKECERGEGLSVKTYEDALGEEDLPADIRPIVERQAAAYKESYERMRSLARAAGA